MDTFIHSLSSELPQDLHFDKYAQKILENSHSPRIHETPSITLDSSPPLLSHQTTTSEFLQKLGATFLNSIQLQALPKTNSLDNSAAAYLPSVPVVAAASSSTTGSNMELDLGPHHLIMDSTMANSAMDDLQNQLNYDKFMNGIWIGVVLALILISMIFCFCSCFLYHQFRTWKRNYRTTVTQSNDVEAVKFDLNIEDPVPEYTLVSGLPSYEAALELLHKNPKSCLIVHPSVFEVFQKNEKSSYENNNTSPEISTPPTSEVQAPLLSHEQDLNKNILPSYTEATTPCSTPLNTLPSLPYNHSLASLISLATQKSAQSKTKSTASTPNANESEKQFKS